MKRNFLVLGLVMLLVAISGLSFAYWDSLTNTQNDQNVTVGEGVAVTLTSSNNGSGKTLIPSSAVQGANDVYSVVFTYNVEANKLPASVGNNYDLKAEISSYTFAGVDTYNNLVNFEMAISGFTPAVTGNVYTFNDVLVAVDTPVALTVTVTLDEPADQTTYDAIQAAVNKNITFTIVFTANDNFA